MRNRLLLSLIMLSLLAVSCGQGSVSSRNAQTENEKASEGQTIHNAIYYWKTTFNVGVYIPIQKRIIIYNS